MQHHQQLEHPTTSSRTPAAEMFRVATPGRHEIKLQVAEGDLVVSYIAGKGVHAGEPLGIPATNRTVETDGGAIHCVRDGKIVEYWAVSDIARVLQQGSCPTANRLQQKGSSRVSPFFVSEILPP
jgi:predicted ester cyclase